MAHQQQQYPPQGQYQAQPQYQQPQHHQQPQPHHDAHQQPQHQYQTQQPMQHMMQAAPPQTGEWQASLCNCSPCDSCLLSTCLPCLLLGKTSERMRDPSLQSYEAINTDCLLMFGITCLGVGCIYAMMKRTEIRERFGIKGSGCGDCCVSFWCGCCALIQQDNEVKLRLGDPAKGIVQQGYQQNQGMVVPGAGPAPTGKH